MGLIRNYIYDESGATAIEYGLLAALIGVAIITSAKSVQQGISELFSGTDSEYTKAFEDLKK